MAWSQICSTSQVICVCFGSWHRYWVIRLHRCISCISEWVIHVWLHYLHLWMCYLRLWLGHLHLWLGHLHLLGHLYICWPGYLDLWMGFLRFCLGHLIFHQAICIFHWAIFISLPGHLHLQVGSLYLWLGHLCLAVWHTSLVASPASAAGPPHHCLWGASNTPAWATHIMMAYAWTDCITHSRSTISIWGCQNLPADELLHAYSLSFNLSGVCLVPWLWSDVLWLTCIFFFQSGISLRFFRMYPKVWILKPPPL